MKKIIYISVLSLMLILNIVGVSAEEASLDDQVDFNIESVEHDKQLNKNASYFHLFLKKDDVDEVEIMIHNNSKEKNTYLTQIDMAKTGSNGLLTYGVSDALGANSSLQYNIEDLITIEQEEVSIDPYSSKVVKAKIDLSDVEFEGILLGAFTVSKKDDGKENSGITHDFQYQVGIALSQINTDELPNSKTLDFDFLGMTLKEGHRVLSYNLLNLEPQIARKLEINSRLTKIDNDQELFNEKVENFSIAPNGTLGLNLDWQRKDVESGSYRLEIEAQDDQESIWNWNYEFNINEEEAQDLNDKATYVVRYPSWTLLVFAVLAFATVANTLVLVTRRIKENNKDVKINEKSKE